MNSSVFETTSLYWIKEHSLYVNDSDLLLVGMGCLWFVRILFWMHHAYMILFVRAGHALNFFFFAWEAAGYLFLNLPTPPPPLPLSKAKWFATNCARTRHEVPSWLKTGSRQPTRPRNTSLTVLKVLRYSFSEAIPIFFKIMCAIHTSMTSTFIF